MSSTEMEDGVSNCRQHFAASWVEELEDSSEEETEGGSTGRRDSSGADEFNWGLNEVADTATVKFCRKIAKFPCQEEMDAIAVTMRCVVCERVPTPYMRYLCEEGHLLCYHCGQAQVVKHQSKCMAQSGPFNFEEGPEHKDDLSEKGSSRSSVSTGHVYMLLCHRKISLYHADPVYTALWKNFTWKCPNSEYGCEATFKGYHYFDHLSACNERNERLPPCIVQGCQHRDTLKDMMEHLILKHHVHAVDIDDADGVKCKMVVNVPRSCIQDRVAYYTIIRCFQRYFLLCVEPVPDEDNVKFHVRRFSHKRDLGRNGSPAFRHHLLLVSSHEESSLKVSFEGRCMTWLKQRQGLVQEHYFMTLPTSLILSQMIRSSDPEGNCAIIVANAEAEWEYLPLHLTMKILEDGKVEGHESECERTSSMESLVENVEEHLSSE